MQSKRWWIVGLIIALGLTVISPLASGWPDGLERVAEDQATGGVVL
jgi:cobalt/nickel transport protein